MDEDTTKQPRAPLDDEELGALVRDVADGWRMPPQRLGQQTWRERAAEREAAGGHRSGWQRIVRPLALAVAATIALAVGVVWIDQLATGPSTAASSPSPEASGSPGPSASPMPAPTLVLSGGPLPIDRLVVVGGGARVVDLTTGAVGPVLDPTDRVPCVVATPPGGGVVSLCSIPTIEADGSLNGARMDLTTYASDGSAARVVRVGSYGPGIGDPVVADFGPPVSTRSSVGPAGRAYVGWTVRGASTWTSGVDVIDLASGEILQTVDLPDLATFEGDRVALGSPDPSGSQLPTFAQAPVVIGSPDGATLVIRQDRYVRGPDVASVGLTAVGPDHWAATVTDGRVGGLTAFATGEGSLDGSACGAIEEAFVDASTYTALCPAAGVDRRVDLQGRSLDDIRVPGLSTTAFPSTTTGSNGARYVWMPYAHRLVRIDADGTVRETTVAPTAASGAGQADGLAAVGRAFTRFIAPAAEAKAYLQPAMALSPDGKRLYLLGTRGTDPYSGAGSTGVIVVDTGDLSIVDRWEPTADFVSIGVGRDGSLVYALGAPGIRQLPNGDIEVADSTPASLTVFDAATGQERAFAGQLGSDTLFLDPALIP
jgi:hypothetical protein